MLYYPIQPYKSITSFIISYHSSNLALHKSTPVTELHQAIDLQSTISIPNPNQPVRKSPLNSPIRPNPTQTSIRFYQPPPRSSGLRNLRQSPHHPSRTHQTTRL